VRADSGGVGIEFEITGEGRPEAPDRVCELLLEFLPR
jgi:hypothetical protein